MDIGAFGDKGGKDGKGVANFGQMFQMRKRKAQII
jgi:hypothetical protein